MDFGDKVELRTAGQTDEHKKDKGKSAKRLAGVLLIFFLFVAAVVLFFLSDIFAVKNIRVTGADRFGESDIIAYFDDCMGENGISLLLRHCSVKTLDKAFDLRLAEAEQNLLFAFPYLKEVQVRFEFPSTLSVTVSERNAVLFLNEYDDYICIDSAGCVVDIMSEEEFSAFRENDTLGTSFVRGVEIGEYSLGRTVAAGENKLLDNVIKLCAALNENEILRGKIESVDISANGDIYFFAPPSLVVSFGGFDDMYARILKLSGVFRAGYDGSADGMIIFYENGHDVFRPNASRNPDEEDPSGEENDGNDENHETGDNAGGREEPKEDDIPLVDLEGAI